ncbi:MAG: hypothetical protein J6K74_08285 [Marinifilaceae bacterium]|nr:hypothetical protein [Marinifilaceae bacterium]
MRVITKILFALSLFVAYSCTKDSMGVDRYSYSVEVNAGFEQQKGRANFDESDMAKVSWNEGDRILVQFIDANGAIASGTLTTEVGGATAKFTGEVVASESLMPPFTAYAVYGATNMNIKEDKAQFQLGELQPLMEAKSDTPIYFVNRVSLTFSQVASAIHLRDLPAQITSVELKAYGESCIAGEYTYSIFEGTGTASESVAIVQASDGSARIGVAPGDYPDGFQIKFYDSRGGVQFIKLPSLKIEKGHNYSFATISEFVPVTMSVASASAYHVDEAGNPSDGTTSDVSRSAISWGDVTFAGAPVSLVEEIGVNVYDAANNLVHTETGEGGVTSMAGTSHIWDYKGHNSRYSIKPYAVIAGEVYEPSATIVTYTRPTITVTAPTECYTSYSKYLAGSASEANKCEGSAIYLSGSCTYKGVTAELFAAKGGSAKFIIDGSLAYTCSVDGQKFTNSSVVADQSWASHSISSAVDFDGATISSGTSQSVQVTGLPYYAKPPTRTGAHPWTDLTSEGCSTWNSDNVAITFPTSFKYPMIATPYFNIPDNINVNLAFKAVRNKATAWTLGVSLDLRFSQLDASGNVGDHMYNQVLGNNSTVEKSGVNGVMTNKYNRIRAYYNYSSTGPVTYIYYLNIEYR